MRGRGGGASHTVRMAGWREGGGALALAARRTACLPGRGNGRGRGGISQGLYGRVRVREGEGRHRALAGRVGVREGKGGITTTSAISPCMASGAAAHRPRHTGICSRAPGKELGRPAPMYTHTHPTRPSGGLSSGPQAPRAGRRAQPAACAPS